MKLSVKIWPPLVLLLGYLVVAYGGFYLFLGYKNLKSPYISNSFVIQGVGANKVRYVALGDSLTAGVGSDNIKDTYVYGIAENLGKSGRGAEVVNLGIPGAVTSWVINFELPQAIKESPDIVTLLIGVNDIHNKSSVSTFEKNYQFILNELLTKTNSEVFAINLPYLGSKKLILPPLNYLLDLKTQQFNKAIESSVNLAQSSRIHFIDLYTPTYDYGHNDSQYYSSDLYHPSGYGYGLWRQFLNVN